MCEPDIETEKRTRVIFIKKNQQNKLTRFGVYCGQIVESKLRIRMFEFYSLSLNSPQFAYVVIIHDFVDCKAKL